MPHNAYTLNANGDLEMNNTTESIQAEIAHEFEKSDLLSSLIIANVEAVAQNVVSAFSEDQRYLADAKVGSLEVWVQRLTGMLTTKDRDYLLQLLQNQVARVEERD